MTVGTLSLVFLIGAFVLFRNRGTPSKGEMRDPAPSVESTAPPDISESEPANATISGRITNLEGSPVAAASVCAFPSNQIREPRCTVSGTNGTYRLADLSAKSYDVYASAPNYAPVRWLNPDKGAEGLRLRAGETREKIDLTFVRAGVEVRGRVRDVAGGPIVGALVTLYGSSAADPGGRVVTRTGEQGEWRAWLPPGRIMAEAIADGYAEGSAGGVAPGQFIEVSLTPESVLEGRVVDAETGEPVVGSRVSAGQSFGFVMDGSDSHSALSDVEGRFRIARLAPGRYKPEARAPHRWGVAAESVLLGLGETASELVVQVHPTATVSGRLVFADGRGCSPGSVHATETTSQDSHTGRADEDGNVRIEGLLPGTYTVSVWCRGSSQDATYEPLVVGKEDISGVTWKVTAGWTVRGVVVDASGRPVAADHVRASAKTSSPRMGGPSGGARVEPDGTFQMTGLATATYEFDVVRDGLRASKAPAAAEIKVDRDRDDVRLVVPSVAAVAKGTIEGTLVDGDGAPVSGVLVQAVGSGASEYASSIDDGSFVIKNVKPGDYRVWSANHQERMRAPGTKDDDPQGVSTTVRAAAVARVKLVVESRRGEIHGRVVDEGGHPVIDAFVDTSRESESAGQAPGHAKRTVRDTWSGRCVLTDTHGAFALNGLSPGTYAVRAYRQGGGEAIAESVRLGSNVTVTIRATGAVSGTVTTSNGRPVERFSVEILDAKAGVERKEHFYRTGGAFALRDLPAGDFHLSAEAPDGRAEADIRIGQGETKQGVCLQMAANTSARGRVVDLGDGQPVPGMVVAVQPAKGARNGVSYSSMGDRKYVTDADGRYEVTNVPVGQVVVRAFPDFSAGRSEHAGHVEVPATLQSGPMNELPLLRVPKNRIAPGQSPGDLGYTTQEMAPDAPLEQTRWIVSMVRPGSAAAKAGLQVGDEITSIEGQDVVGANGYVYKTLVRVPENTTVTLGLRRGASVVFSTEKASIESRSRL